MRLELEGLSVRYGRRPALTDVSLAIESRALGLLGPNGAGKSTLIRTLLGLVRPGGGGGRLDGLDIRFDGRRIREGIGYMPEHECYLSGMSVVRYLRLMGEMGGLPPRSALERAHEVLFYVGLGEVRYRPLDGFSYGLQQKARLAQALIHGPRILILDEPTNGLDPAAREDMLGLIREMVERSGSSILMSSHLLRDIEQCCEDVIVLKAGRLVAAGRIAEMRQSDERRAELRLKGDVSRFLSTLAERGYAYRLGERESVEIEMPPGSSPRSVFEIAGALGVQVRHFHFKSDSLEDLFLQIMETDGAPVEPSAPASGHARL